MGKSGARERGSHTRHRIIVFTFEKEKKIMKNKFNEKIARIFITMLCPMLLLSACHNPDTRPSAQTVSGAYSGITFGIDSAVNRFEK